MTSQWIPVCQLSDILPDTGVCALVDNNQVAIFRVGAADHVYAINNYDPIGKANVLSRGLLAHLKDQFTVASPLYKHHFRLSDGVCLENAEVKVATYPVRVEQDQVLVGLAK